MDPSRPGTATGDAEKQAYEQHVYEMQQAQNAATADQISSVPRPGDNPFATPMNNNSPFPSNPASRSTSRPASARDGMTSGNSSGLNVRPSGDRYFKSRRIQKGEVERPWLERKDPKEKWVTIIPLIGIFVGLAITGFLIWDGIRSVTNHKYCPVLDDNFASGLNGQVWSKEVEVGGFG